MVPDAQGYLLGLLAARVDGTAFELHAEVHWLIVLI